MLSILVVAIFVSAAGAGVSLHESTSPRATPRLRPCRASWRCPREKVRFRLWFSCTGARVSRRRHGSGCWSTVFTLADAFHIAGGCSRPSDHRPVSVQLHY